MNEMVWFLLWVLLPIVPAILIFKFLPAEAIVSGPLAGLTIKFGGAFAGYLVIVLLSKPLVATHVQQNDAWLVTGDILLEGQDGNPRLAQMQLIPPGSPIDDTGHYQLEIYRPASARGSANDPHLVISYNGYQSVGVPLADAPANTVGEVIKVTVDAKNHKISVPPITLKRKPVGPYTPPTTSSD